MIRRTLQFAIGGNAFRAAATGAFSVLIAYGFYFAASGHESQGSRSAAIQQSFGPWPFLLLFGLGAVWFGWIAALSAYRVFVDSPALEIHEASLVTHRSFLRQRRIIPLSTIENAAFDRADRLRIEYSPVEQAGFVGVALIPTGGSYAGSSWGARQGAKCRTLMQIAYRDDRGRLRSLRVMDNQIAGGKWSLARFTRDLRRQLGEPGLGRNAQRSRQS